MSVDDKRRSALAKIFADDASALANESYDTDPAYRAALEDAESLHEILDKLVKLRKALGLTQKDIAERLGVRQPTVSSFENESSDPRLSTLQRYARAVEGQITFRLEMPAHCDWITTPDRAQYSGGSSAAHSAAVKTADDVFISRWATADSNQKQYGLAS
ncbi:helix-turn-helix domain-containing protein [Rhodococcus sp. NBC_00294]|uniref:helix-turn-helix domain-containing protein n=1 Tax=Rhodococcus sp. NBC_00294 TaxID=2976004 RepID=UPI002E28B0E9|nr:helix-turn-helix domain-containing protein [Rhodococcus sp. NBC_00294]